MRHFTPICGYLWTNGFVTAIALLISLTVMGKCPPCLQALIALANLTGRKELVDLGDLWFTLDASQDMWAAAEQAIVGLPREFQDYIGPVRFETRQTFVPRWDRVYRARQTLAAIINTAAGPVGLSEAVGARVAELKRNASGELEVTLAAEMQGLAGLPANRLAHCRQCGKFLWMARLRLEPLCSSACRQAKWREENPKKYQQSQIEYERKRAQRETPRKVRRNG